MASCQTWREGLERGARNLGRGSLLCRRDHAATVLLTAQWYEIPVTSLFTGLPEDATHAILSGAARRRFRAGETLLAEGDAPAGILVIVEGAAEVVLADAAGEEHLLNRVGPGAAVGELSVLTGQPISATVRAVDDLTVALLDPGRLQELVRAYPKLLENIAASLSERLARSDRRYVGRRGGRVIAVRSDGAAPELPGALAASAAWHDEQAATFAVDDAPRADRTVEIAGRRVDGAEIPELTRAERATVEAGALPPATPAGAALGKVARRLLGLRVGLAFGGGAVRSWAHFGAWRLLEEHGVPVDVVAGTSGGGAIAAYLARGTRAADAEDLLDSVARSLFRPRVSRTSLLSGSGMARAMKAAFGERSLIEDLELPLGVTATDLRSQRLVVLTRGVLWEALCATTAIPGIFPPHRLGPYVLVDGGVLNPVPTDVAADLGADIVIGVKLTRTTDRPERGDWASPGMLDALTTTFTLMQGKIANDTAALATILIEPTFDTAGFGIRKFREGRRFVETGYAAAETALPRLATALPWLARGR
jgi:NTE family protein